MKKRKMMIQYEIKKNIRKIHIKKIIFGILAVIITIIGCVVSMTIFSYIYEDESTIKMISSATSILVLLELYDAFQKAD